jgi:hypothetical protein
MDLKGTGACSTRVYKFKKIKPQITRITRIRPSPPDPQEPNQRRFSHGTEIEQEDAEQAEVRSLLSLRAPVQSLSVGRGDPEKRAVSVSHFYPRNRVIRGSLFLAKSIQSPWRSSRPSVQNIVPIMTGPPLEILGLSCPAKSWWH